jgi:hypothetical protein
MCSVWSCCTFEITFGNEWQAKDKLDTYISLSLSLSLSLSVCVCVCVYTYSLEPLLEDKDFLDAFLQLIFGLPQKKKLKSQCQLHAGPFLCEACELENMLATR